AALVGDGPQARGLVVDGGRDAGAEAHVPPQVEAVDHVVEVTLDLRLLGEMLRPLPVLEELPREEVCVGVALRVEARAGVAVPVPGAADAVAGLEQLHGEPRFPRQVELVDTGDASTDHEHVDVGVRRASVRWLVGNGFGGCHGPPRRWAGLGLTGVHAARWRTRCGLYRPVSLLWRLCRSQARGGTADGSPHHPDRERRGAEPCRRPGPPASPWSPAAAPPDAPPAGDGRGAGRRT